MYKYLTRAYVEALGLEIIPIHKARNQGLICWFDENRTIPSPGPSSWAEGVVLEGRLYERERPYKSFVLLPELR